MNKCYLILSCLLGMLFTTHVIAQTSFEQYLLAESQIITNFIGTHSGSVNVADIDGDGLKDVLITGSATSSGSYRNTKLYITGGMSRRFVEVNTPFPDVASSSSAIFDANGDGFPDVLISGYGGKTFRLEPIYHFRLYLNDGVGNLSEFEGSGFSKVTEVEIYL